MRSQLRNAEYRDSEFLQRIQTQKKLRLRIMLLLIQVFRQQQKSNLPFPGKKSFLLQFPITKA